MQLQFAEPATIAEAHGRKRELSGTKKLIQIELSERRITAPAAGGPAAEYRRWRKAAVLKLAAIDSELQFLNDWMRSYHAANQKQWLGSDRYQEVRREAHYAVKNLQQYADGLATELAAAQAENTRLRNELAAARGEPVAPGDGVDEWRNE